MDVTITIGTWWAPLASTAISAVVLAFWCGMETPQGPYSMVWRPLIAIPAWIIVSLLAWLVWAVLT